MPPSRFGNNAIEYYLFKEAPFRPSYERYEGGGMWAFVQNDKKLVDDNWQNMVSVFSMIDGGLQSVGRKV